MGSLLMNKVVLITGASRGIGAAIARAMSDEGARVAITYHANENAAKSVAVSCMGETMVLALDVADRTSVDATIDLVTKHWGRIDVLVNNAGYLHQLPFADIDDTEWARTLDTNLKGVFLCTQVADKYFQEQSGDGAIINITSVGGQMGGTKAPHYAAAKAGVISMTKSAAKLLAPHNVRVNAIAPGFIKTDMYEQIIAHTDVNEILDTIPLGHVGLPENVADAAVFLSSNKASYITGHVLNVNGGLYLGSGS